MSILKLLYVRMEVQINNSPFGVPECEIPDVYEKYEKVLDDRVIVKIDALNSLQTIMDRGMFLDRELLYGLVSGSVPKGLDYGKLLASYYKKFASFGNYVDGVMMFNEEDRNVLQNIMIPIRKTVDNYKADMKAIVQSNKGRLVLDTHDYLYFAFKTEDYEPLKDIKVEKVFGCLKRG